MLNRLHQPHCQILEGATLTRHVNFLIVGLCDIGAGEVEADV